MIFAIIQTESPVQAMLRTYKKNNASLIVNGVFNEQTLYELMVYQKKIGLTVDGVVGPQTREALYEYHPW